MLLLFQEVNRMKQLMFDNEFNNIIEDNHLWKNDEIPSDVIDFIKNKLDSKVIFELSSESQLIR